MVGLLVLLLVLTACSMEEASTPPATTAPATIEALTDATATPEAEATNTPEARPTRTPRVEQTGTPRAEPTGTQEAETAETPEGSAVESGELTVFAAASLTDAFNEIGEAFEANGADISVVFNFAGSQQLAQQLGQDAPADVFASANRKQMEVAIAAGRVVSGTQQVFVRNRLVVVTPADNPGQIETLPDLAQPGLKIVFAAEDVPVGQYSREFLDKAAQDASFETGYKEAVLSNVVSYEENVKAVLTKVVLGEADAGIVYSSDIALDEDEQVQRIDIPDALNSIATYPIAVIEDSEQPTLAEVFVEYVLSEDGQAILEKYGFIPVK